MMMMMVVVVVVAIAAMMMIFARGWGALLCHHLGCNYPAASSARV